MALYPALLRDILERKNVLTEAAEEGYTEIVRALLDARYWDDKVLVAAASSGHLELVRWLLSVKFDPNLDEGAPLIEAAKNEDPELISLLLDSGAEMQDKALATACWYGNVGVVRLFLDRGADVNVDIVDDMDLFTVEETLLMIAVQNNWFELVKLLLDNGADVHAQDDDALLQAVHNHNIPIARLLLDNGADVSARDEDPLSFATESEDLDMVKLLVDRGADIHLEVDEFNFLTNVRDPEIIQYLIEKGVNVHFNNEWPLKIAVTEASPEVVRVLLSAGADYRKLEDVDSLPDEIRQVLYERDPAYFSSVRKRKY
jgi:ankyrin repeat protein